MSKRKRSLEELSNREVMSRMRPFQLSDKEHLMEIGRADCLEMVVIPAGSFIMGSPEEGRYSFKQTPVDEKPQHRVEIKSFAIGKYPVTQEQWYSVMENNPSFFKGRALPVERVSWDDVQQFIVKLNQKTGLNYRLPSEAEWEYAARAGSTTEWSFGTDASELHQYAWYKENSNGRTNEVGQKLPSAFGLFDMHGNVSEWTQDCYRANYIGAPTDGSPRTEEWADNRRVLRGGSWDDWVLGDGWDRMATPSSLRSAARDKLSADLRMNDIGFRLAVNAVT